MPRRALRLALGLLALALLALPATPRPAAGAPRPAQAPAVTVISPAPNTTVGDTFGFAARVSSELELATIVASVGGISGSMARNPADRDVFSGELDLSPLDYGPYTLTVTATDSAGASAQASLALVHDGAPTLTVVAPADQEVAGPALAVRLSCADDSPSGCAEAGAYRFISRFQPPAPLITGTASISGVISLADFDGFPVELILSGRDALGSFAGGGRSRLIFVDRSPNSAALLKVRGQIIDADATRVLVKRYDERSAVSGLSGYLRPVEAFVIVSRATGAETVIAESPGAGPLLTGWLTSSGAVYQRHTTADGSLFELREWRSGATTTFDSLTGNPLIRQAGDYTIWLKDGRLYRRDSAASQTATVFAPGGAAEPFISPSEPNAAVAANGDVVYALSDGSVRRYRAGKTDTLIDGAGFTRTAVEADGVNVAYNRCGPAPASECRIVLLVGAEEQELGPPATAYRLSGGWVAFTREGGTGLTKVWRRAPDGREEQISPLNSSETLDQIGPDGTIVFNESQFVSRPGQPTVRISTNPSSRVYLRDGVVERSLGRVLFSALAQRVSLPLLAR
jgi:hypothetical protein